MNEKTYKWTEESKLQLKDYRNTTEYIESRTGANNPVWKGGVSNTGLSAYDTFINRIPISIQTRRDPYNEYVLQTICMECGKWFSPKKKVLQRKISGERGWNLYCSRQCSGKRRLGKSYISKEIKERWIEKRLLVEEKKAHKIKLKEIELLYKKDKRIRGIIYRHNKCIERKLLKKQRVLLSIKKEQEKQIALEGLKRDYPEIYKKYSKSKVGLWFEINRWQSPIEWRIQRILVLATKRAKQKGWKINLTKEWIRERITVCEATGIPFDNSYEGTFITMNPYAPSIDRIDNSRGYTMDNCRIVLTTFNSLKSSLSDYELYVHLKQFVEHYKK